MEVVIAGAGSIGLLIGSYLAEAGWGVTFFVRREEQAILLRNQGIRRVDGQGTEMVFNVNAETDIGMLPATAPWIVAVKFGGVASILELVNGRNISNPMMFVQNGIGHFNMVSETELPHLFFASVEHGAGRLDDRTVSHNGVGLLKVAPFRGDERAFDQLTLAHSAAFPVEFVIGARELVLRKVLINCMINPLTAILQLKNGELLENTYAKMLFDELFNEIIAAFPEMQDHLSKEAVEDICRKTAMNRSSMLKDRLEGNPMEIETIVSAVIGMAERRGSALPLLKMLEKMLLVLDGR